MKIRKTTIFFLLALITVLAIVAVYAGDQNSKIAVTRLYTTENASQIQHGKTDDAPSNNVLTQVAIARLNSKIEALESRLVEKTKSQCKDADISDNTSADLTSAEKEKMFRENIEFIFSTQKNESEWGEQQVSNMQNILNNESYEGTHVDISDCRESICRFSFSHADSNAMDRFNRNFMNEDIEFEELKGIPHQDGELETEIFISRLGYQTIADAEINRF